MGTKQRLLRTALATFTAVAVMVMLAMPFAAGTASAESDGLDLLCHDRCKPTTTTTTLETTSTESKVTSTSAAPTSTAVEETTSTAEKTETTKAVDTTAKVLPTHITATTAAAVTPTSSGPTTTSTTLAETLPFTGLGSPALWVLAVSLLGAGVTALLLARGDQQEE
ncbi:MAG: hypothetical protein PVF87_01940 [Acidimicrobiia bacterium]|jgi:hypothetical protein